MGACWALGEAWPCSSSKEMIPSKPLYLCCTHCHTSHIPTVGLTQLPIFSVAKEQAQGPVPGARGEGSEGKAWVFLGHPLTFYHLVAGPDNSPPIPCPLHSGLGPRVASSLSKSSKGLQSGADRAKHRYSQCCEVKSALKERMGVGSMRLSLER